MLKLAKLAAQLTIVGSAVYFTYENSIWDKSEYANAAIARVKESFPDTDELLKKNLPNSRIVTNKWNETVESVFNTVGNPCDSYKKFGSYISNINK